MASATSITATCQCKAFTLTTSFPQTSIPIHRALCLCTSCRLLSGSIGGNSYIQLPPPPYTPVPLHASTITSTFPSLKAYSTSEYLTRYWCGKCGAQVFVNRLSNDSWHLATGLWDFTEGVVEWTGCKWVEDTIDGGISVWLKDIDDFDGRDGGGKKKLKRWRLTDSGKDAEVVVEDDFVKSKVVEKTEGLGGEERLHAFCHCGGVRFFITRPNDESARAYSPFSDLIVPYHSGSNANPTHEPWFLRGDDAGGKKKKYLAGTCACTSCRHALGFEIQTWAFVPKCNIFSSSDRSALDYGDLGTLKRYVSGEGIYREFCGTCGANVFWHCDERPEVVDISVGLFDSREGVRCESWLEWWTGRVSFAELGVSEKLIRSLGDGLKEWEGEHDKISKV